MDAGDLRVFEAVARLGGMNKAAAELNTVQSNVTSRIRLLEERIGTPLFRRHTRGVALTAAGERLLPYARQIARLLAEAKRAVEDDGSPKGKLVIGSLETTAAYRLPPVVSHYAAAFPAVSLSLRTATNTDLIDSVLTHKLDGAFVCGPIAHPEIAQDEVFREELVIATPYGRKRFGTLVDGRLKILVKGAGCAYRQRFEAMLERDRVAFDIIEFGTLDAIIGCVSAGLGETMLPRSVLDAAQREKKISLHALASKDALARTFFIRRKNGLLSSALASFVDCALSDGAAGTAAE